MTDGGLRQYGALAKRAVFNNIRQPASVVPSFIFPLLFLAMLSASLANSTRVPGFPPVDSFFQFMITTTIIQGTLFGSIAAGVGMAVDIEHGFFERLIASPVSRTSILFGPVAGSIALGFVQASWFLGIALIFGLHVEGGIAGMAVLVTVAALVAGGVGALNVALAIKTGSNEAVQGSFPLTFALMFLSSAFFPRNLMGGWFKSLATANPFSHLIEGLRTQVISGFDASQALSAYTVAAGLLVGGLLLSGVALRGRLKAGE